MIFVIFDDLIIFIRVLGKPNRNEIPRSGSARVQLFTGFVPLPTKDLCLAHEGV